MASAVITQVVNHLESLPLNLQEQVLVFVRALDSAIRGGVSGHQLLQFAGSIPDDDLQLISKAIENDCEQVDLDEW